LDALRKVQEVQEVQKVDQAKGDAEHDGDPYTSALATLRAQCPAYAPEDRWRQAIADATTFITRWGTEAHALSWTTEELFALPDVPDRPAANYSRLARLDDLGLLWILRARPVVALKATETAYRCPSGAILTYRRKTTPISLSHAQRRAA
jgi:hypothetical protein